MFFTTFYGFEGRPPSLSLPLLFPPFFFFPLLSLLDVRFCIPPSLLRPSRPTTNINSRLIFNFPGYHTSWWLDCWIWTARNVILIPNPSQCTPFLTYKRCFCETNPRDLHKISFWALKDQNSSLHLNPARTGGEISNNPPSWLPGVPELDSDYRRRLAKC